MTAPEPDDFDRLFLLWADGDHRSVAREILSKPVPDAIRVVLDFRREYEMVRPGSGDREAGRILAALDIEHGRLVAALGSRDPAR